MKSAVLCSGGLDSVVLLADELQRSSAQPLYVSEGLAWESAELEALERLLPQLNQSTPPGPLVKLQLPMNDVYAPSHWALTGKPPAYDTPDEDVYLVGRNLTLLAKAGVYCSLHRLERIVLGPLAGNPFPDARPEFLSAMGRALSIGLDCSIEIAAPFLRLKKSEVIQKGIALGVPLELTLSCMNPMASRHCGACSKCRERRDAFRDAGVSDPTKYAQ